MRVRVIGLAVGLVMSSSAVAYDNGPRVVGCDYKIGKNEETDKCLILGSGTNQGISWIVFEVKGKRFRYQYSSPKIIELIGKSGKTLRRQSVRKLEEQCRPGGRDADVYAFSNGDRICLYW